MVRERAVVMAVAGYHSRADAERDMRALAIATKNDDPPDGAVVLVEKGAAGALTLERQDGPATNLVWTGVLLGALLTVVAAPLGISFLAPVVSTRAAWAGVASLVSHIWYQLPKDALRRMSDVLETSQAALVVVAVDRDAKDVEALLPDAATIICGESSVTALEAEYANAIDQADALG